MNNDKFEGVNQRGWLAHPEGGLALDNNGDPIPVPRLCDRGCNDVATYGFNGSWLCVNCYCAVIARGDHHG